MDQDFLKMFTSKKAVKRSFTNGQAIKREGGKGRAIKEKKKASMAIKSLAEELFLWLPYVIKVRWQEGRHIYLHHKSLEYNAS